ncbi:DUF6900 domain-containing protein [Aliiroseovarius lamellibrachiae]|uniref:DUF6900 domain-containing protein n=1 Tax=Aliiroseovarius lamellibrachiae TaxID=1924933 RepID=UPI001BE0E573|nr:hypothetical protein [Aliiroseovarius lamellibrachiae]MBT2130139.1 hypothetical protein [Aliiroseovarius lamellibrachiae]
MQNMISEIARKHLGLETLEAQNSDSLDFKELSVWEIEAALKAAFQAGQKSTQGGVE